MCKYTNFKGDSRVEKKVKHLEMIQNIIQRMANNSFLLKGWTVSLIVAIFILSDGEMNQIYFLFAYIPVISFWILDSYYLQLERRYITLYDLMRASLEESNFDLSIKNITYKKGKDKRLGYINCLFSISEMTFYIPIALLLSIIYESNIISIWCNIFGK